MQTIGIIMAVVGFGSIIAYAGDGTNIGVMQWSEGHQPYAGLAVGVAGLVLALLGRLAKSGR